MNSNENLLLTFFLGAVTFLFMILLILLIIFGIPWIIRQLTYEVCTYKTIIVDDRAEVMYIQGGYLPSGHAIYLLSFKFEDGEIMEFSLPLKAYKKHIVGDVGELTFQGDKFIKFIKTQN